MPILLAGQQLPSRLGPDNSIEEHVDRMGMVRTGPIVDPANVGDRPVECTQDPDASVQGGPHCPGSVPTNPKHKRDQMQKAVLGLDHICKHIGKGSVAFQRCDVLVFLFSIMTWMF
jgi:hypothetical protein